MSLCLNCRKPGCDSEECYSNFDRYSPILVAVLVKHDEAAHYIRYTKRIMRRINSNETLYEIGYTDRYGNQFHFNYWEN